MTADDRTIALSILHEDVRDVATAVLVLKYAQAFYGADAAVAHRLAFNPDFTPSAITIPAGGELCFDTHGTIVAPRVTDNGEHAALQRLWLEQRFHGDPDLQRDDRGVYTYRIPHHNP